MKIPKWIKIELASALIKLASALIQRLFNQQKGEKNNEIQEIRKEALPDESEAKQTTIPESFESQKKK